ncbi:MAG: hypothetical protein F4239_04690 [Gammaproteobacteria bacterium]|nr:hypothetical protein [Gammaproteobacteria bacterium]
MSLRYQSDEKPSITLVLGLGLQLTTLSVSATILITTLVMRAGGQSEAYLAWAVFAAVVIGGACSVLQTIRFGRFGTGHVLMMGSSVVFIAVGIQALSVGGPSLFATLVVAAAIFQFLISHKLAQFRRLFTPTVSGTVLMLIPVSVMPAVFKLLEDVPQDSSTLGAPLSAILTVVVIGGITLKSNSTLRLWAPVIGIIVGSLVAATFGLYDTTRVLESAWIGLPEFMWPGISLEFDKAFWALFPAFLLAAMISAIRTMSGAVAIQSIAWRKPKAVDYRGVQGAVATDSLSNLFSGLAGTMPNTSYTTGASLAQITGVAARTVGFAAGGIFLALAFFPKVLALILAIPGPVFAAFLFVMVAILFMIGTQMVFTDGIDYRKSLIVGIAFWTGVGFQNGVIFPEIFSNFAHGFLNDGMTSGALVAIILTLFMKMTEPRSRQMKTVLELSALSDLTKFAEKFATANNRDESKVNHLNAVVEEVLLTLLEQKTGKESDIQQLILRAKKDGKNVVLEFITTPGEGENLEDKVALLSEQAEQHPMEENLSLRVLQHLSTRVRHQKYSDVDIITVRVES